MEVKWDFTALYEFADKVCDYDRLASEMERATKEIAHELLKKIKQHTPIGDTWRLINGWDGNDFAVTETPTGFEVLLVNPTEYATWVNDGHRQKPGRFIPGHFIGGRFYYDPTADGGMVLKKPFVKGRLFVEKGILDLQNTTKVESIINKHLYRWWKGCF